MKITNDDRQARRVYLARMDRFYKIGMSLDPERRRRELERRYVVDSPDGKRSEPIEVVRVWAPRRYLASSVEAYLMRRWRRFRGACAPEWFELSSGELEWAMSFDPDATSHEEIASAYRLSGRRGYLKTLADEAGCCPTT